MKVTISGRGIIPYVRAVAPVSGIDVDIKTIRALLNVPKFSVYDYATGIFINQANIDSFENPVVEETPVVEAKPVAKPKKKEEPKVEKKVDVKPEPVIEAPVVEEPVKEEYVEPAVEVIPEETPAEEPVAEEAPVEESVEEAAPTEETKPTFNGYNGKKKKHH